MSPAFSTAVSWVMTWEGGYTNDPSDPGNWTGGAVGIGECKGTNFGISAASYPTLDIANLTEIEAHVVYARDYWTPIRGDDLPPALAMVTFDGAVNSGVRAASVWLQSVVGASEDGIIGPQTLAAVGKWNGGTRSLCAEVLAQRVVANGNDPNFGTYGLGWSRRTTALAFQAATLL